MDQPAAAEIVNLHKTFKTGLGKPVVHAVRGIDMSIRQGEVYGLIGPNGSGKSTLMKALLGLVRPTEGSCAIFGKSSLSPDSKEEVGFLPENPYFYKFLTGAETVSFYGKLCGLSGKSLKEKVRELLDLVGLADKKRCYPNELSGGEQQRVAIARALAMKPDILCFDEPTSALDPELTGEVLKVIRSLAEQKTTMIIVTHEMAFARDVADQVIFMDGGVIVEQGDARQVIENPQQERTRQFLSRYSEN